MQARARRGGAISSGGGLGLALGLVLVAASACGDDDGGSGGSSAGSSGAISTGGPADPSSTSADDGSPPTTDDRGTMGSGPGDTTIGATDESSGEGDGSTGGTALPVELVNDGWTNAGAVFFQQGFVQGECWASTFAPQPEHYPFEVIAASMVVGGADSGSGDFSVAIWSVDETGQPMTELSTGAANISGDDNALDIVPLAAIGVQTEPFTDGNFALVVCFTAHSGLPAIAADGDGLTHAARNWIRLEDGSWLAAADAGVSGDWITRATIQPM
jgi:hypothetical protein